MLHIFAPLESFFGRMGIVDQALAFLFYQMNQTARCDTECVGDQENRVERRAVFPLLDLQQVNTVDGRERRQLAFAQSGVLPQAGQYIGDGLGELRIIFHPVLLSGRVASVAVLVYQTDKGALRLKLNRLLGKKTWQIYRSTNDL